MYHWSILALAVSCATKALALSDAAKHARDECSPATSVELSERYAGGYYFYPQVYSPDRRIYRPYAYGRVEPYRPPPYYGGYNERPQYWRTSESCPTVSKAQIVSTLEATMGGVQQASEGLEQVLMRLRYRPRSPFEFPRIVLETARAATAMSRELREVLSSVPNACLSQGIAGNENDDDSDGREAKLKERFVASLEELKKSAKSLESAVAELFESPFKAFSNIGEVFSDLRDSLTSAVEAVIGNNADDNDDGGTNSGNTSDGSSSSDNGFAAFTSFTYADTSSTDNPSTGTGTPSPDAASTDKGEEGGYSIFTDGPAPVATGDSSSTSDAAADDTDEGLTRRFTFTAEDVFTFSNEMVFTVNQATFSKEFDFTTAEYYRFTDTTVFVENIVATPTKTAQKYENATATSAQHHEHRPAKG